MKNSHHHIRDSSLTRGGRGRDSSLPRFKEGHVSLAKVPSDLVTSLIAVRHNLAMPELGAETMKYNRQNAVKDIHSNFMRSLKDTNNKINSDAATTEEIEKRTKSYQKIISDAPSAYYNLTEEQSKKHCMRYILKIEINLPFAQYPFRPKSLSHFGDTYSLK